MTHQHQDNETYPSGWDRCPPGKLFGLGRRLRGRKTRRQFLKGAAAAVGVLVTGGAFGLWWAARRTREFDFGGITCSQVIPLMGDYMARKLPLADQTRVGEHLALCPRCRALLEKMNPTG